MTSDHVAELDQLSRQEEERPSVLIADDELSLREVLGIFLEDAGFEVSCASHADEACELIQKQLFTVVLTDLRMPRGGGMRVLEFLKNRPRRPLVIMMTAYASAETAVEAMKLGAHDYLIKPFKLDALKVMLDRALEHHRLIKENERLKAVLRAQERFEGLIGRSAAMKHVFEMIRRVAPAKTPILVLGESGTGKEMVAKAIHAQSNRSDGPFVALNCAALPEHLLESTLFGHRRGAFTGAVQHQSGLFQAAHEGTLFLDEIGEMPLNMQAKVLRALQEQKVLSVGSLQEEEVDLRVIAATNRPLLEEVRAGRFREDLYYRLNVIPISLPPLRERPSDIPLLVEYFIEYYAGEFNKTIHKVNPSVMRALSSSAFPGNVRELKNLVERAVALSTSVILEAKDFLWDSVMTSSSDVDDTPSEEPAQEVVHLASEDLSAIALFIDELDRRGEEAWSLDLRLEEVERSLIREALDRCHGNRTEAAKYLKVSFRSLRYRLKKLKITDDPLPELE